MKLIRKLLLITGILAFLAAFAVWFMVFKVNTATGEKVYLNIPEPASWDYIVTELKDERILSSVWSFKTLAEWSGYSKEMKAGRYEFRPGMNNKDILKMLVSGRQSEVRIVIRSSWQKEDLTAYVASNLNMDSVKLVEMLSDNTFLSSKGWNSDNILAAFIPNTYFFYWNTSAPKFFDRMMNEYGKFWNETRSRKAGALSLTHAQVSILASIIEKETAKVDEMPTIAGVYLNRLRINMALQADPTVKFALGNPDIKRISRLMTEYDSPYNTYKNTGLPPGPICLPSIQAIDAVLNYRKHNYLYFCAKEDFSGYHNFTDSYEKHLLNSRKYQLELDKLGIR